MHSEPQPQEHESIELAQRILEHRYKGGVRLEAGASLRGSNRSHVVRCRVVEGPAHSPDSVVVKRALPQDGESYDPNATSGPAVRLCNEWAGLQFLGECFGADAPVPRFYGGDRAGGVIVMEDLGAGVGLDSLLLGDDGTAAENALIELFQVVGRMHAVSIGQATRYQELRTALGPPAPGIFSDVTEAARSIRIILETLGLTPHAQLDTELMACAQRASEPEPFNALIHCDPCPDNCLVTAQGLKLLDFEFGQFGLALWDGAYARSHFPTCWCVNRIPHHAALGDARAMGAR